MTPHTPSVDINRERLCLSMLAPVSLHKHKPNLRVTRISCLDNKTYGVTLFTLVFSRGPRQDELSSC